MPSLYMYFINSSAQPLISLAILILIEEIFLIFFIHPFSDITFPHMPILLPPLTEINPFFICLLRIILSKNLFNLVFFKSPSHAGLAKHDFIFNNWMVGYK